MTDKVTNEPSPLEQLIASLPDQVELFDENDQPVEDGIIDLNDEMKRTFAILMLETGDSLEKVFMDTLMHAVDRLREEQGDEEE
jgi:hypothetical protein